MTETRSRPPHVVIADDNLDFLNFVATVCRRQGWTVSACENGASLIDTLRSGDGPALVLIDVNMPEVDGIEAIEAIAFIDRPLRLRFVTGGDDAPIIAAGMIARARELEVGRHLFKPISKAALLALLAEEEEALSVIASDGA